MSVRPRGVKGPVYCSSEGLGRASVRRSGHWHVERQYRDSNPTLSNILVSSSAGGGCTIEGETPFRFRRGGGSSPSGIRGRAAGGGSLSSRSLLLCLLGLPVSELFATSSHPHCRPFSCVPVCRTRSPQADHLQMCGRGVVSSRAGLLLRSTKTCPLQGRWAKRERRRRRSE